MVKSAVRVVVRTRPTSNFAHESLKIYPERKTIDVFLKKDEKGGHVNNQQEQFSFKFDEVLHNVSQETVYEECAHGIVKNVLEGYNGTILAYGQTGAGKTFTMTGGQGNYKYRGLIPRAIAELFGEIQARPEQAILVRISYLEIYNEQMYDLLAGFSDTPEESLQVLDDAKGSVVVKGLTQQIAHSEEEALNYLFEGDTNRSIAAHQLNKNSTRSHCIFSVAVEVRSRVESSERIVTGKLNLVDLAGSERVGKTGSDGAILREAMYINKSLTFLEQVVVALCDRNRDHVPYRSSKLTNVLRDSLGGNCKTVMIANMWGEASHLEETISTLKFAMRMMHVRNDATLNIQMDPTMLIKKYEREIRELKQELAMHDSLSNRTRVVYDPYTPEQRHSVMQAIKSYCAGELEELEVNSVRQVREYFQQFKILVRNLESDGPRTVAGSSIPTGGAEAEKPAGEGQDNGVGDVEGSGGAGFALGVAPANAKPINGTALPEGRGKGGGGTGGDSSARSQPAGEEPSSEGANTRDAAPPIPTRNEAFEEFKRMDGAEANTLLKDNQAQLKDKKRQHADLARRINENKKEIDTLKDELERKKFDRENRDAASDVIDEEEYSFLRRLKDCKKTYREVYEELKVVKSEIDYLNNVVDSSRVKLVDDFNEWFDANYGDAEAALLRSEMLASTKAAAAAAKPASRSGGGDMRAKDEEMDDGEWFEQLEKDRVMQDDPDSVAYYQARKNVRKGATMGRKVRHR